MIFFIYLLLCPVYSMGDTCRPWVYVDYRVYRLRNDRNWDEVRDRHRCAGNCFYGLIGTDKFQFEKILSLVPAIKPSI